MSNPYASTRGVLQMAVAERLEAGLSLRAICAQPGMPCRSAVWTWTRAYPWFAEELTRARRRAESRRVAFDEAVGAAIVARVAAGERIGDILADPAMPSRALYRRWRAQQGHFAAELYRLERLAAAERARRRAGARPRPYDPDVADRIYLRVLRGRPLKAALRADPEFPSYQVVTRWRRERPQFDRAMAFACSRQHGMGQRDRSGCTPQIIDAIADRVVQGASLARIARDRRMPSIHTLYAWKRTRPDFAEALAAAREARAHWCEDQIQIAAEEATPATFRAARSAVTALKKRNAYLRKKAEREEARNADD